MVLAYARGEAHVRLFGQLAAADLTVVLEHVPGEHRTSSLRKLGKLPDFALEVGTSPSEVRSWRDRMHIHERVGIGEYFVFQPDPEGLGRVCWDTEWRECRTGHARRTRECHRTWVACGAVR